MWIVIEKGHRYLYDRGTILDVKDQIMIDKINGKDSLFKAKDEKVLKQYGKPINDEKISVNSIIWRWDDEINEWVCGIDISDMFKNCSYLTNIDFMWG